MISSAALSAAALSAAALSAALAPSAGAAAAAARRFAARSAALSAPSRRALIGTHRAERIPRLWTLLPLLNRWSAIALLLSTPWPLSSTWLMIVREAWIF